MPRRNGCGVDLRCIPVLTILKCKFMCCEVLADTGQTVPVRVAQSLMKKWVP